MLQRLAFVALALALSPHGAAAQSSPETKPADIVLIKAARVLDRRHRPLPRKRRRPHRRRLHQGSRPRKGFDDFLQEIQQSVQPAKSLDVKIAGGYDAGSAAHQGKNAEDKSNS